MSAITFNNNGINYSIKMFWALIIKKFHRMTKILLESQNGTLTIKVLSYQYDIQLYRIMYKLATT